MFTHRFLLVDQPDGRQTIAVYTATEIGQLFSAEAVARLALGQSVLLNGKRHTDMQAFVNVHRRVNEPRASVIERMRQRLAGSPRGAVA